MHAPEQPGSARPQERTNAFLGHGHFIVKREVLEAKEQFSVQNGHRKGQTVTRWRRFSLRYLSSLSAAGVMQVDQDQLNAGDFD